MNKRLKYNLGFSLVEMIVALGIFLVVISMVVLFFNQSLVAQRRVFSSQNIQDNLRYAIEFMTREIRMGSGFDVGEGAPSVRGYSYLLASDVLKFKNSKGEFVTYSWDQNAALSNYHLILRNGQPIISQNVEVYDFAFVLNQGLQQPRITIIIKAQIKDAKKPEEQIPIIVQTTVSPRNL